MVLHEVGPKGKQEENRDTHSVCNHTLNTPLCQNHGNCTVGVSNDNMGKATIWNNKATQFYCYF